MEFESKLSSARVGGYKADKQLSEIGNITKFYKSRGKVIKFYNDYFEMIHKAAYDVKHGTGFKILTPKQMLQRLPIALVQVKPGNSSKTKTGYYL